jgi:transposase
MMTGFTAPWMPFCHTRMSFADILQARYGEMFGTTFDFLFYDITSTYFEGNAKGNPQAQRGYSRDKRPDCPQVCIGLVASREGLPVVI